MTERPDWRALAACRGMGPDLFFPSANSKALKALAVCRGCAVVEPCRQAGADEPFGVWGQLTINQRKRIAAGEALEDVIDDEVATEDVIDDEVATEAQPPPPQRFIRATRSTTRRTYTRVSIPRH